jgi:prephenate dehydrogenase
MTKGRMRLIVVLTDAAERDRAAAYIKDLPYAALLTLVTLEDWRTRLAAGRDRAAVARDASVDS